MQLTLPAVQSAREAARKTQCKNNLRQIGLGVQLHVDLHQRYPSGGWYHRWVGEPERGTGPNQPGGWVFNVLDFVEASNVRELGIGTRGLPREQELLRRCATPIPIFNCPSRRPSDAYPLNAERIFLSIDGEMSLKMVRGAKSDYAACAGGAYPRASLYDLGWTGPESLTEGDRLAMWPTDEQFKDKKGNRPDFNGVIFSRSKVRMAQITDGTSKTYLLGEKSLGARHTTDGHSGGDNESMYNGFNDDTSRSAYARPLGDWRGDFKNQFGSAHPTGWHAVFADGSVHYMPYDMYLQVHRYMASRAGEEVFDTPYLD